MIRRFAKFITLISLVVTTGSAWAQDVTVYQFMANPLFTNPGFDVSHMTNKVSSDALITANWSVYMAMFGEQHKELILGCSFDYSLSSSITFNGGAQEITLSYQIKNDKQHKSKSMNQVPI